MVDAINKVEVNSLDSVKCPLMGDETTRSCLQISQSVSNCGSTEVKLLQQYFYSFGELVKRITNCVIISY